MHFVLGGVAGIGQQVNPARLNPHIRQRAQHIFRIAPCGRPVQRHLGGIAPIRADRHQIEHGIRLSGQRLADGVIQRLLIGDVIAIKADDYQRLCIRRNART